MRSIHTAGGFKLELAIVLGVLLTGLALGGCGGEMARDAISTTPAADAPTFASGDQLAELGLKPLWKGKLALLEGDRVVKATLSGNEMVVLTRRNMCFTVSIDDGKTGIISAIAPADSGTFTGPTSDEFHYWFAGTGKIIGVNQLTGQVDKTMDLVLPASTRPISDKEYVFVGALDGRVYGYTIASQQMHTRSKGGAAVVSIALANPLVIVARSDVEKRRGDLVGLDPALQWAERWQKFTDGPISAPLVVSQTRDGKPEAVFVACEDGSLYRFNATEGWRDWQARTGGALVDSPILLSDSLVQKVPGVGTCLIHRNRLADGDLIAWKVKPVMEYLSRAGERMYFLDGKSLVCLRQSDGKLLGKAALSGVGKVLPVANSRPDDSRLLMIDAAGHMICAEDLGQPYQVIDPSN